MRFSTLAPTRDLAPPHRVGRRPRRGARRARRSRAPTSRTPTSSSPGRTDMTRTDLALLRRWTRTRLTLMRRTPRAVFFTFAFPLHVPAALRVAERRHAAATPSQGGGTISFAQFYTPSIAVFGPHHGVLLGDRPRPRRRRATPGSSSACAARRCRCRSTSRAGSRGAALTGLAAVVLMFAVAVPALRTSTSTARMLPAAVVTIVLGAVQPDRRSASRSASLVTLRRPGACRSRSSPSCRCRSSPGVFYPLAGAPAVVLAHRRARSRSTTSSTRFDRCFQPQTAGRRLVAARPRRARAVGRGRAVGGRPALRPPVRRGPRRAGRVPSRRGRPRLCAEDATQSQRTPGPVARPRRRRRPRQAAGLLRGRRPRRRRPLRARASSCAPRASRSSGELVQHREQPHPNHYLGPGQGRGAQGAARRRRTRTSSSATTS